MTFAASTDYVITFTTASTSTTTSDFLFTILKTRSPPAMPPTPEPPPLRGGEIVRVTAEGVLKGRTGTVSGFLELEGRRLTWVRWPGGGRSLLAVTDVERASL